MQSWNQINNFVAVARTENMSEAAELLHISQPSLSQTIKRLEEELGFPLFERRGKRLILNENGKIMLRAAKNMEEIYRGALTEIEENNARAHREVSIYIGCASMHLPQMLQFLKKRTPQIKYHIFQWRQKGTQENDIDVIALDGRAEDYFSGGNQIYEGRRYEVLFEEEILLALPADYPMAEREHLKLADVLEEDFICLNENWALGAIVQKNLALAAKRPEAAVWVDNPSLMRDLLRSGQGMALVPAVSWKGFGEDFVRMKKLEDFDVRRTVCLRYPQEKYITREDRACMDGIREYFETVQQKAELAGDA